MPLLLKRESVLPGFGLSLGVTLSFLSLLVLLPFVALALKALSLGPSGWWDVVTAPRALAAYRLSFGASAVAAMLNGVFGLLVAWVLARYAFPGKRIVDALVDLPFALPTAVAGIALTTLYGPHGWLGSRLEPLGLKVVFSEIGITVALTFIGLPFVVRTLQPLIQEMGREAEEAAASLGASRSETWRRVVLPTLLPAWLTGVTLALSRALGEYGSVVFIAGNMPMKTEIAPLLIMTKLEQYDYAGATAIALVMLLASFALLLAINVLQAWSVRRSLGEAS